MCTFATNWNQNLSGKDKKWNIFEKIFLNERTPNLLVLSMEIVSNEMLDDDNKLSSREKNAFKKNSKLRATKKCLELNKNDFFQLQKKFI